MTVTRLIGYLGTQPDIQAKLTAARDSLIDELAGYAKIEAEEDSTGYVRIKLEDVYKRQDVCGAHDGSEDGARHEKGAFRPI